MNTTMTITINGVEVGNESPVYFIADIAANHDSDLARAKELIYRAAEAGADAAKFQNFTAATIVSDKGFRDLGSQVSHQAAWEDSVYDVYDRASLNVDWTLELKECCVDAGIAYMTTPYNLECIEKLDQHVDAFKIGSGDITWHDIINKIANINKPYMLATGASDINEVMLAARSCLQVNSDFVLMQCNTNYTASRENFRFINLNVLKMYKREFGDVILGLSDHTLGDVTVLGAVALGAKVIEKHFTDDTTRKGPDHSFSMDPASWKAMVERTRDLEAALGAEEKKVEENEKDTVVVQRRSARLKRNMQSGEPLQLANIEYLRPAPNDALAPYQITDFEGKALKRSKAAGDYLTTEDFE